MKTEFISLEKIAQFGSRSEEFSPYDWYKHKLQNEPVSYNEETDTWNVFRYNDVKRVLSDYENFSNVKMRTTVSVGADIKEGSTRAKLIFSRTLRNTKKAAPCSPPPSPPGA